MAEEPGGLEELLRLLAPVGRELLRLDLGHPRASSLLAEAMPLNGRVILAVRRAAVLGAEQGWLLPKERKGIRFGRVTSNLSRFSVDAVLSSGPGPRHRHPRGEVDLLFALSGDPRFDGHPAGWAVYPPGSEHVPEVTGGEMLILYFLPGGSIEWVPG